MGWFPDATEEFEGLPWPNNFQVGEFMLLDGVGGRIREPGRVFSCVFYVVVEHTQDVPSWPLEGCGSQSRRCTITSRVFPHPANGFATRQPLAATVPLSVPMNLPLGGPHVEWNHTALAIVTR